MDNDKQKLIEQINAELQAKNEQMKMLLEEHNVVTQYIMHGTHMSPEEFKKVAGKADTLPAFNKHTQNELDTIRPYITSLDREDFSKIDIYKRVFGIESKKDSNGKVMKDEQNQPIPQDGSYAYSLKKCSAAICFSEDGIPILIGLEKVYSDYEQGSKNGYIYCLDGKNFKPEFDKDGNITEWTSLKDETVLHVTTTSPHKAMDHNVQFVIFKSEEDLETAMKRDKDAPFENTLAEDSTLAKRLRVAIASGKATYINASSRGHNPQIKTFIQAQQTYDSGQQQIMDYMEKVKDKLSARSKHGENEATNPTMPKEPTLHKSEDDNTKDTANIVLNKKLSAKKGSYQ